MGPLVYGVKNISSLQEGKLNCTVNRWKWLDLMGFFLKPGNQQDFVLLVDAKILFVFRSSVAVMVKVL